MFSFTLRLRQTWALAILLSIVSSFYPTEIHAEGRSIEVAAGSIVELTIDAPENADFSWVLTKDRKFINAQRTRFFQTRQTLPGTYTIDVNIRDTQSNTTSYEEFTLIVGTAEESTPTERDTSDDIQAVLETTPQTENNKVRIEDGGTILRLDPTKSKGKIARFALDLDSSSDTDGDGDPLNDTDNADTVSLLHGSPLYVLAFASNAQRTITLTTIGQDSSTIDTASLQLVHAGSTSTLSTSDALTIENPDGPIVVQKQERTVTFSPKIDELDASANVLYEWDFGDNGRSLLKRPKHTYTIDGSYSVQLSLRDLTTGEVLKTFTVDVDVQGPETSSSSSSSSSTSSSVETKPETTSSTNWSLIFSIIGGALGLLILAALITALVKFIKSKTGTKLEDALKTMEDTLIKDKDQSKDAVPGVVPMRVKKPEEVIAADATPASKEAEDQTATIEKTNGEFTTAAERTNETPLASAGPVPSWLTGSTSSETKSSQALPAQDTAIPSWLADAPDIAAQVQPETPISKEPEVVSTTAPQKEAEDSAHPSWMEENHTPQGDNAPTAQEAPAPVETTPQAPAESTDEVLPPWLAATKSEENGDQPVTAFSEAETDAAPESTAPTNSTENVPAPAPKEEIVIPQETSSLAKEGEILQEPSPTPAPPVSSEDAPIAIIQADSISEQK